MRQHHRAPKVLRGWLYNTKDGIVTPQGSCNSYARLTPRVDRLSVCMYALGVSDGTTAGMYALSVSVRDCRGNRDHWARCSSHPSRGHNRCRRSRRPHYGRARRTPHHQSNLAGSRHCAMPQAQESERVQSKQVSNQEGRGPEKASGRAGRQAASSLALFVVPAPLRGGRTVVIIPLTRGIEARLVTIAVALPR